MAARFEHNKNMVGVARALLHLRRSSPPVKVTVDWYGGLATDPAPYFETERFITENDLGADFRLNPATTSIQREFASSTAVGLFSFFEGLPNAVCEGMACGKPILMSNVCDAGNLVRDGENGFLCDPDSPESIAAAIRRLVATDAGKRRKMGEASRKKAEELFRSDIVIDRYERILEASASRQKNVKLPCWPPEVPESALRTVNRWTLHG